MNTNEWVEQFLHGLAILYQMFTGRLPFGSGTPLEIAQALALEEPTPANELNPKLPEALDAQRRIDDIKDRLAQ